MQNKRKWNCRWLKFKQTYF